MQAATLAVYDDGKGRLGPMTDLRPAFDVRTGALTTLERIETGLGVHAGALFAPERLVGLLRPARGATVNALPDTADVLAVNGRCALPPVDALLGLSPGEALVERASGECIGARLARDHARALCQTGDLPAHTKVTALEERSLVRRPWDVIALRDRALARDLEGLAQAETQPLPPGVVQIGDGELTIDPSALVYPTAVFDLEHGPVVVAAGATVRPGAIVCGPAYVGPGSTVIDRAHIKANTAIGPTCKVGGEVGGTIFQGLANKSHDGHLGDAWVGEWANFGAGTTNSNLLNTYGEVPSRLAPDAPTERTGLTFFGCVVGDHVKFAIGTRIMTGAVIGTGSMIASSAAVTGAVTPFAWVTDEGERAFRLSKFLEVARAAMARRKATPTPAYAEALRALHARWRPESGA